MGRIVAVLVVALGLFACQQEADDVPPGRAAIDTVFVLTFPEVETGASATRSTIVRADNAPIYLSPVEVEPPFTTDLNEVEKLEPGATRRIHFTFSPTRPGHYRQDLEVRATGSVGRYRLLGEAIPGAGGCVPTEQRDVHVDLRPTEDILLVVDDHRSMAAVHDRLLENVLQLPAALDERGIDWRIAVTTTGLGDGCDGGLLRGEPPFLASGDDEPRAWLEAALDVPTCDGNARGLDAARRAATEEAGAFRRERGGLTIFVVSTRDDRSPQAVAAIVADLQLAMDRPEHVRALAVVGDDAGACPLAEPGTRWTEAVARLGGMRRSICTEDWQLAGFFDHRPQFGVPIRFPLRGIPLPAEDEAPVDPAAGDVQVFLDGAPLPYEEGHWRYDREANAVVFFPDTAPRAGETVEIVYTTCART